jgi:hypothetical protein
LIHVLKSSASNKDAALTSVQLYEAMQCHPSERTIRERLKHLSNDETSCVTGYQKPVTGQDGKSNKKTWHYWFEQCEVND